MIKLNIGAGGNTKPQEEGWINIDLRDLDNIQQVMDLEICDLPYEPESVDHIQMQDFIEHLGKHRQNPFLRNVYSVLKPGGTIFIQIPHLGVLAERYCNILENPTELQHPLDADQLASSLYGGQEYEGNLHKWGYDESSLVKALSRVGISVNYIGSDGGQNLLCKAMRPPEKVYLSVGGGLGDAMQVYLSNPINDKDQSTTSDPVMSMWFRRLRNLRNSSIGKVPKVVLVIESHNPFTRDLFEYDPCIDEIITSKWLVGSSWEESVLRWENISGGINIDDVYSTDLYEAIPDKVYMNSDEQSLVDKIKGGGKYIVVHPFAGSGRRVCLSISKYRDIIDEVIDAGYNVIVVGASYKQSCDDGIEFTEHFPYSRDRLAVLVNKVSARVSVNLIFGSSGFIGTHSAMILAAWYKKIKSVCIVPEVHDDETPWEEFFSSNNPTTHGAGKDFNKTIIVNKSDDVSVKDIVKFVTE